MKIPYWRVLLVSILISLGTGLISALVSATGMRDYAQMYHPPLSPPGWVFPLIWTILYVLMGVAAYIIWVEGKTGSAGKEEVTLALTLYGIQLGINAIWSPVFFNLNAYFLSFSILLLLWLTVYLTLQQFYKINMRAGYLLIPYLFWVTFAGYLNLAIAIHAIGSR